MEDLPIRIITTEDGSHSLFREDLNETYHSFHGALGESIHIFIEAGLSFIHQTHSKQEITIFEVGLGTGLNALLTAAYAAAHQIAVSYHTIEPYPVPAEIYSQLNYARTEEEKTWLQSIHECDWGVQNPIHPYFQITKYQDQLINFNNKVEADAVYFDAFAPSKQPDVWTLENLSQCFDNMKIGGVLTTYCAQGQFKRNLKAVGFEIEALPGAMGKKEMVRARKP